MKIYVGRYWVPSPSSEYGGTWTVIAKNANEVYDLLKYEKDEYNYPHNDALKIAIHEAQVFELNPEIEYNVEVVTTFFT